jgi:hypothetical protein
MPITSGVRTRRRLAAFPASLFVLLAFASISWLGAGASWASSTHYVSIGGSDANPGTSASPWRTIQHAADVAGAGDIVLVQPGTYVGAKFSRSGASGAPITFHGQAGAVVASPGALNSNSDNLWVRNANYIVIEGFEVRGAPRAGIAVQGEPTAPATGIVVRNNNCHDNGRWGIFTGYAQDFQVIGNVTAGSAIEHGIYVSNSSDNPVIRGNVVHDNHASGIQINADPALPGDGIITNALVENNVVYDNGVAGGAAINRASVRNSLVRNNLLYNNHASGIAGWDDGDGSRWGTKSNRFLNNTIVQASDGRFAVSLQNGSTGNVFQNDVIFHTGTRGSYDTDKSSRTGLVSDYNVVTNVYSLGGKFVNYAKWRSMGFDTHSVMLTSMAGLFVNPSSGDFHLPNASPAIDAGTTRSDVPTDLEGVARPQRLRYDIGAYEAV